jgi:CubicO group peptidase (beta-lactamase class C family)
MRLLITLFFLISQLNFSKAQNLYFPPLLGTTWDTMSAADLNWCQPGLDSLNDFLDRTNTKAFIALKDGKIVLEKYFGNHGRDSLWFWASAGKTLTSFTVGIAQQEGFLSINDTSSKYLGTGWTICPPNKEEKITILNQLTMTSGLNDAVPDHYCTLDTCLQYLADAGTRWAYHNGPYTLLDEVISNATGQTLNAYFNSKVRSRIGMNGGFFRVDYNNVYFSNARSMARFGLLMLNRGTWNGTIIMSDSSFFNQMITTSQNLNQSYGYLWWLNGKNSFMVPTLQNVFSGQLFTDAPADMYAALGRDGQIINVVPSENLVIIRMGEAPGTSSDVTISYNNDIWKKINDMNCLPSGREDFKTSEINIFPNPVGNSLNIQFDPSKSYENYSIEIINSFGQLLKSEKIKHSSQSIEMDSLTPQSFYFVRIIDEMGQILHIEKIVRL